MKRKRKRKSISLIIIIVGVVIFGCRTNISDINEIQIVNPFSGEKTVISKDNETTKRLINGLNKKEKSNDDTSQLFSYEVYLKNNSGTESYLLSFDLKNETAYISKDNTVYKIKENVAKDLLMDENFYYVYIYNTLYKSYLKFNERMIEPTIEYRWNYKNLNGDFIKKEGTLNVSDDKIILDKNDLIDLKFEREPDNQVVRVYSEGKAIYTGKNLTEAANSIKNDGTYLIESEVQWLFKDNLQGYGNQTISFMADVDVPADFEIVTKENYPGNIFVVSINNINEEETVEIETDIIKMDVETYNYENKMVSLLPIDINITPGDYDVTATFNKGLSKEYKLTKKISIKDKIFKVQYLTVSEELNESNNNDEAIAEFIRLVKPARTESSPEKLWEGIFIMPVEGTITTDFAEIRYVNNEKSSSRHSGLDIAAPLGTDIKAPNNGIVTFAMNGLLSSGNTIVIDHGMGLFTSYYHLDSILVKTGEEVKKGDVIGTVGTTGFSTGPHLHYAVSIYNTYVNTYQTLSGIIN